MTSLRLAVSAVAVLLSACLVVAIGVASAIWNPIDAALVDRADAAGWNTALLLPHENLLWLAINGALVLGLLVLAVAVTNMVLLVLPLRRTAPIREAGDASVQEESRAVDAN